MAYRLDSLAELTGAVLHGDPDCEVDRVATLAQAGPGCVSFLTGGSYRAQLPGTGASVVVLKEEDLGACQTNALVSSNPYLTYARIADLLYPPKQMAPGIHPAASVAASARIADTAYVAAGAVVGEEAAVGEHVYIGPNCVLGDGVVIGEGSRLVAAVTIYDHCQIGQRCLLHAGAVIGSDGFGNANDQGVWVKVPQVGRVLVGDDVEIGANTAIDRGAIGDTVIRDGVKLDNLIHIAHNVEVGEHTAMAACVGIAGSTKIGRYCTLAGQAGVVGHVELADHVHVSAATPVTRSLTEPGVYSGLMAVMPHAEWQRNVARIRQLDKLARRVRDLEKRLAGLEPTTTE